MKQKLIVDCSSPDKGSEPYAWNEIYKHLKQAMDIGATSGKTTIYKNVPDGYGGGSESYEFNIVWKLEDVT